jgi:hypothetical protein
MMDMQTQASLVMPTALLQAVRRLLRPLARLLMAHGVDFPAFSELSKDAFVDVAARDFPGSGESLTDSRVSLLSGVHRREVKRIREESVMQTAPAPTASLGALVVARWCGDARYLDAARRPMPLPRLARQGGEQSFENLVAGVNKDIRPRAVLDEWLRLGAVHLDEDDRVHLAEHAFVPARGLEEKAFFFGKNIADHLAAGTHNLLGGQPPFVDRCVYYDQLSPASIEELRELTRRLAVDGMQQVNQRALELQQRDADAADANQRMTFGLYFYAEPSSTPKSPAP